MSNNHWCIHSQHHRSTVMFKVELIQVIILNTAFHQTVVNAFTQFDNHIATETITNNHISVISKDISTLNIAYEIDSLCL